MPISRHNAAVAQRQSPGLPSRPTPKNGGQRAAADGSRNLPFAAGSWSGPPARSDRPKTGVGGRSGVIVASAPRLTPRQQHLIGTLRRADENWLELWELARRAGYTIKITAANVRELRRRELVVTRPRWYGLSNVEVSLRGPR